MHVCVYAYHFWGALSCRSKLSDARTTMLGYKLGSGRSMPCLKEKAVRQHEDQIVYCGLQRLY